MDLGITGRKAIVCASSRGLGRGCAEALAAAGCQVVINGRDSEALARTEEALRARGGAVQAAAADISTRDGQAALLAACPEPDILVNNNGGPPGRSFRELDREQMLAGLVQNMITPIELIQAVVDGMAARGFGRIVNITSVAVLTPIQGLALSSGARAGLTAFLGGVCREVGPQGVTINNLLPDRIATDRLKARIQWHAEQAGTTPEEEERRQASEVPVGRFGTPEEFGQICAFLCSRHAGYITGRNIPVDGGLMRAVF